MFKKYLLIISVLGLVTHTLEGCSLFKKNRCETCPGVVTKKKVRKSSKGSL